MQVKNKTGRILLIQRYLGFPVEQRLLAIGGKFERQRILPDGMSKSFIPLDRETIEITEVAPKKAR